MVVVVAKEEETSRCGCVYSRWLTRELSGQVPLIPSCSSYKYLPTVATSLKPKTPSKHDQLAIPSSRSSLCVSSSLRLVLLLLLRDYCVVVVCGYGISTAGALSH